MTKLENTNKKYRLYKLVNKESKLTEKEEIFKLVEKIEKGKSIAGKLSQLSNNVQEILTTKIVYKYLDENKMEESTLLHYAMLCSNEKAINNISQEAKKYQLLEKISGEETITEFLDSERNLIRIYSTIEYKNGAMIRHTSRREPITRTGTTTTNNPASYKSDKDGPDTTIIEHEGISTTSL